MYLKGLNKCIVLMLQLFAVTHSHEPKRMASTSQCPTACSTAQVFVRSEAAAKLCFRQVFQNASALKKFARREIVQLNVYLNAFGQWKRQIATVIRRKNEKIAMLSAERRATLQQQSANQEQLGRLQDMLNDSRALVSQLRKAKKNRKLRCSNLNQSPTQCPQEVVGQDCAEIYFKGGRRNGVYLIKYETDDVPQVVYCDQVTDGGGWTLIHKHINNEQDFNQDWISYKHGFGYIRCDGKSNFWLGNENIHQLTSRSHQHLRVDVEDWTGINSFAVYTHFRVGSEVTDYTLTVGGYRADISNDIGDGFSGHNFGHDDDILITKHQGMPFSTHDRDNDRYLEGNCASYGGGGWWYNSCSAVNLNGMIYDGGQYRSRDTSHGYDNGMIWAPFTGLWHSLKTSNMKLRPASFKSDLKRQNSN